MGSNLYYPESKPTKPTLGVSGNSHQRRKFFRSGMKAMWLIQKKKLEQEILCKTSGI